MGNQKYYLGLDMGTNSVGWAVTDPQYVILRKKGKDLWGIREFDEAQTAVDRRTNRISRRRRQKEVVRMGLLRTYFDEAIREVDPNFFARLDNSKYHVEDKDEEVRYANNLFHDSNYTDKEYYKQYPTVFHLRKELIDNPEKHDVRLVYLAISNMFKHRGHFLNDSLGTESTTRKYQEIYNELRERLEDLIVDEENGATLSFPGVDAQKIVDILEQKDYSRSIKSEKISELLGKTKKDKIETDFIKCLCGLKVDANKLFPTLSLEEKVDIEFSGFGYEDKVPEIINAIGDENYAIIELLKELYDAGILSSILKGSSYLSYARVAEYEKHKNDLALLKKVYKEEPTLDYNDMFREESEGSYSAYVKSCNSSNSGKSRRSMGGRKIDDFYGRIKKELKGISSQDAEYILKEIENEHFLPKQLTSANGVIPNQVHAKELKAILKNAAEYLPFLKDVDESKLSVMERIERLFEFHVPYYIGPVTENSAKYHGNGWVIRKADGPVLPWNMEEKIDVAKTSEAFITRMVRDCTYLRNERVLPKSSLEYERYCVLNEINNLRIDGEKITVALKQDIYNELFKKGKRVTKSQLVKYLLGRKVINEASQLTGVDININNALTSWGRFASIFKEDMEKESVQKMVEQIIFWATVYGDSKEILKKQITENYSSEMTQEQMKRVLGYKFKDWGNISKAMLELPGCDKESGEQVSLIRAMWDTNYNFMELLYSDRFTFMEELESRKSQSLKSLSDIQHEDLDEYYFSAPVKRMVWQTLLIIKEITEVMGCEPDRIFIEMTRTDEEKGDKGRKDSRKQKFLDLYKGVKDDTQNWKDLIESSDTSGKLRSKKMYLYLLQMGRDMYTGKKIDLDKLFDDNLYDIDHIYPRSFVKDDNLDNNMVLVTKTQNSRKSNVYPLDESIVNNPEVRSLWYSLHEKGFMNDTKYSRLTSRSPFTEEQQAGFIARQMVETRQANKAVADIIKSICPDSKIIYSKAGNVSDFRRDHDLFKSRIVNDFHHANDAYLNIVVGNAYYVKFTANPLNFIRKEYAMDRQKNAYNLAKMFDRNIIRGGEEAWIAPSDDNPGTIDTVKKMMAKNTPLMTRLSFEGHGGLANATLYSHNDASKNVNAYLPLKSTDSKMQDVSKYGGFTSAATAYFVLVESERKGKRVRSIECVPIYLVSGSQNTALNILEYFKNSLGLVNPSIVLDRIKVQSLIKINGFWVYLSGRTGNQLILRNAVNLCLNREWISYINKIEKENISTKNSQLTSSKNIELYELLSKKFNNDIFGKRPNNVGGKLIDGLPIFKELSLEKQIIVLKEIFKLVTIGVAQADFSLINGAKITGKMLTSKYISDNKEFKLINQSVTGIYENTIDLLSI